MVGGIGGNQIDIGVAREQILYWDPKWDAAMGETGPSLDVVCIAGELVPFDPSISSLSHGGSIV